MRWYHRLLLCIGIGLCLAVSLTDSRVQAASSHPAEKAPPVTIDTLLQAFPDGMSEAQIEAVASTADPALGRNALSHLLRTASADRQASARNADQEMMLEFYSRRLREVLGSYAGLPEAVVQTLHNPRGHDLNERPWTFIGMVVLIGAISILGWFLVHRWLLNMLRCRHPDLAGFRLRAAYVASALGGLATYVALIVAPYLILHPTNPAAPVALELLLRQGVTFWLALTASGLALAPKAPLLRLLPVGDRVAQILYRTIVVTMALTLVPSGFILLLWQVGLPLNSALALWLPASALPFLYLLAFIVAHRGQVIPDLLTRFGVMRNDGVITLLIPLAIAAYLVVIWLLVVDASLKGEATAVPRAILSFAVLLAIPLAGRLINFLLTRFFAQADAGTSDVTAASPHDDHDLGRAPAASPHPPIDPARHAARLMRAIWIVILVLGILGVSYIWGFSPTQMGVADYALRILANIGIVILLGYVGWALIQRWVDTKLHQSRGDPDPSRAQRMQTLLPLFRNFLRIALTVTILMIVLASLGIEIGPLLAGAGVVGIAIGLGAQQTIADILAGVFFLFEDSFRMNDYVEVGNIRGTVEGISLRSLKLRHQRGMLHTLPFGQIKSLTNYTRDWALMRLEFRLPHGTDLELVRKLVKRVGEELAADPEMGPDFIQPPKSQGVRNIEGNALIIGVKYITRPGRQFVIRRMAYHRILAAFEAHGIQLMGSGVVVRVEHAGHEDPAVLGAAAGAAIENGS